MSEAVRRLKASEVIRGKKCGWCREPLTFGEDAAICRECRALHHGRCWDERGGCARSKCVHAPPQRIAPAPTPAGPRARSTVLSCPHCGAPLLARASVCRRCGLAPTHDGVFRGRTRTAPGAENALVLGMLGFFGMGFFLGPIAIRSANRARSLIARDPQYTGGGMATAGLVLGIVDTLFWGIALLASIVSLVRVLS